jgi:hypothetical protein
MIGDKKKDKGKASSSSSSARISADDAPAVPKKKGRPLGSKSGSKGPAAKTATRALRKSVDEIKDTRAAIARYRDDLNKLVKREREQHPGARVAECPDLFASAEREPVAPEVFVGLIMPPAVLEYRALDVMSALPEPEVFGKCGQLWSEASKHFEESKYLPLIAAVACTAGIFAGAPIVRFTQGKDANRRDLVTARPIEPNDPGGGVDDAAASSASSSSSAASSASSSSGKAGKKK